VPYVIEPAAGANRTMAAFLLAAYDEDEIGGEPRTVLRLHPRLAPYQVAVLPLSRKDTLLPTAREVLGLVQQRWMADYDDTQSIGRRYRRQDEIGTPLAVTVDFESLEDRVTIRDRDTTEQVRCRSTHWSRARSSTRVVAGGEMRRRVHETPIVERARGAARSASGGRRRDVSVHEPPCPRHEREAGEHCTSAATSSPPVGEPVVGSDGTVVGADVVGAVVGGVSGGKTGSVWTTTRVVVVDATVVVVVLPPRSSSWLLLVRAPPGARAGSRCW
jgi:hypothetical protein